MPLNTKTLRLNAQSWLERWLSNEGISTGISVDPLAGDGSQRSFYRVRVPGKSFVFLSDADWISSKDYPPHQAYLAGLGIRVPRFLAVDPAVGCLLMEDLGDEYLQTRLINEPERKMAWLAKAVETLADLHTKTFPVPSKLPVAQRSFDVAKLSDEMKFTFDHLVRGYLADQTGAETHWGNVQAFCAEIAEIRPLVFCHRDYHSRNLMVFGEDLFLIDFQDARLGPPHYDLASLIYDAYVPISTGQKNELVTLYKDRVGPTPLGQKISWTDFQSDLEIVAFQRVVKAAGSFASFFTRFGKDTHLKYLVPALKLAESLQRENARLAKLDATFPVSTWVELAGNKLKK